MNEDSARKAVIREASDWVVRLHGAEPSAADRTRFVRWLKRSPVHVHEFLQTEADWLALERVDAGRAIDVDTLLRTPGDNVVPLGRGEAAPARARRGFLLPAGLAAAAVLAVFLVLFMRQMPETYETALGEQRTVVLADGSIVELNTQSRIRVRMTGEYRDIELLAGEALFSVAPDSRRPFRVLSDPVMVQAVGTQFNVYRRPVETVVTVLEGNVRLRSRQEGDAAGSREAGTKHGARTLSLSAGDRAVAGASAIVRSAVADPRQAVAWRERRLVFDGEPLADAAAEFNRYNGRRIIVEDPALAKRRISGVFNADRPEVIVRFVARNGDAVVIEHPDGHWTLRSAQ